MSGDYRDPLGAAHARITELEEKVATLEAERTQKQELPTGRFPELETKIEGLRLRTNDKLYATRSMFLNGIGIIFPLLGALLSYAHLPIYATLCSCLFLGMILLNIRNSRRFAADKKRLVEVEKELADAHRIADLETRLAATEQRIRVGDEEARAEPLSESDDAARTALRS